MVSMIENDGGVARRPAMPSGPSAGRIVHYVSAGSADGKYPSVCRSALVTEVPGPETEAEAMGVVGLMVINPTGLHFRPIADGGAEYDPDNGPYTWHWPERI